jgi:hypothetical protein
MVFSLIQNFEKNTSILLVGPTFANAIGVAPYLPHFYVHLKDIAPNSITRRENIVKNVPLIHPT